jgi:hypothetical protein
MQGYVPSSFGPKTVELNPGTIAFGPKACAGAAMTTSDAAAKTLAIVVANGLV